MRIRRIAVSAAFAIGLAALPLAPAKAQYYPPCSPFPLFWPFCVAGAIVGTAATIVTAPFLAFTAPPYYCGCYGGPITRRPITRRDTTRRRIITGRVKPAPMRAPSSRSVADASRPKKSCAKSTVCCGARGWAFSLPVVRRSRRRGRGKRRDDP